MNAMKPHQDYCRVYLTRDKLHPGQRRVPDITHAPGQSGLSDGQYADPATQ